MTTGPTDPTVAATGGSAAGTAPATGVGSTPPPPPSGAGTGTGARTSHSDSPSLGSLVSEITQDFSTLVRQEVELAKAELTQSAKRAGKGAGMFSGAALAGHMVLLFLSIALWWGIGDLIDSNTWSAVIVAVVWGVIAAILAMRGRKEVQEIQGAPRTAETVKKIPHALKGQEEENR